jgi:SNF2 family DNA or RNA helicase
MLFKKDLHGYQKLAIDHILKNESSGLFLDMGLGKTVSSLTAIDELLYDSFDVKKVLIIAPLRVARSTWTNEVKKWEHLKHLKLSKIIGTAKQRLSALETQADIYVINRENIVWLIDHLKSDWDFDMLVIDELSSFKSNQDKRFKALKKIKPFVKRLVGLTGTPAPNSLMDLWPQMFLLDGGKALGKNITGFRNRYFRPEKSNGHIVYTYALREGGEQAIHKAIESTCISMKATDWLNMPEYVDNVLEVNMGAILDKRYKDFEREKVLELETSDVIGINAGAMFNKLLQFGNGAVYDEDKNIQLLHDAKLEALEEIVSEANGQQVLVFYNFKHDLDRLQKKFKHGVKLETEQDEQDWNSGQTQLMFTHPASSGHGLNLQESGAHIIVWFGLTCSLELYQQANARLYRQGQKAKAVIVHHIVTKNTFDEAVMQKLELKEKGQSHLLAFLKVRNVTC